MTDKDKAVALELLGDEALVAQLAARLGDKNRTLDGAISYTVEGSPESTAVAAALISHTQRVPESQAVDGSTVAQGATDSGLLEYELDEAAVATLSDVVMERAVRPLVDERTGALRSHVDDVMSAFTAQVAAATANLTALETRLEARLALLEKDDQTRYQQYDQAKPPQPVIKLGVRPRAIAAAGAGTVKVVDVAESEFARKTREKRQKQ